MSCRLITGFRNDIKIIFHNKTALALSLSPLLIILLLWLKSPLTGRSDVGDTMFHWDKYYSLFAISGVSIIPIIFGIVCKLVASGRKDQSIQLTKSGDSEVSKGPDGYLLLNSVILSLAFVLLTIIIVRPVPTEGWLRSLYTAALYAIQAPVVFLFIYSFQRRKNSIPIVSKLYWLLLIAVPSGLLLHHPWNYLTFFSPLYWTAWAWIVKSPVESLGYGLITVLLTAVLIVILYRFLRGKTSG